LRGDTFAYNVIEPFGRVLFKTGDSVALPTVGSEITPMCKAIVNAIFGRVGRHANEYVLLYFIFIKLKIFGYVVAVTPYNQVT